MDFSPLVRKLEHLYPLSSAEMDVLKGAFSNVVAFASDQDIVREDDCPTSCNLLLEGMVCRYVGMPNGKRQILSFHTPGDIFDAQSFMIEKMDHSVGTLTACKVAVLPHKAMKRLTDHYPRIARAVWKDTLLDAAVFRQWIVNVGRRNAYKRIAHLICEIYTRLDVVDLAKDGTIMWPLTQAEVGDATGLSQVQVNRTLQDLRREKLIELHRAQLQILDWRELKRAGEFDPKYLHITQLPGRVVPSALPE
jgi:CRP-like cAMP-binding protein